MSKSKRRLTGGKVKFISLCPRGANMMTTFYKSDEDSNDITLQTISKGMDEDGEIINLVYVPEHRDSQGDIASAEVIKKIFYESTREGIDIDIKHNEKALSKKDAFIAEQFLVQKSDPRFQDMKDSNGKPVDATGAWATIIKVDSEDLRAKYRNGEWGGVSMGGEGYFKVEKEAEDEDFSELQRLSKKFGIEVPSHNPNKDNSEEEESMKPEEIAKLVTDTMDARDARLKKEADDAAALKKSQTPEKTEDEIKAEELAKQGIVKPTYKGKLSDRVALRKHRMDVELYEAAASCDFNKAESLDEYDAKLDEISKSYEDLEEEEDKTDSKTVKKSSRMKKSDSNQDEETAEVHEFLKEDDLEDQAAASEAMAKYLNEEG